MLLHSLDLLFSDPLAFLRVFPVILVIVGIALVVAISVHEASHALIAYLLGDRTAQRLGRLSLNPLKHLDPAGTLLLILVGFGWGKPVPVNPMAMRTGRRGMALVAAAGPVSNIVAAVLLALPVRAGILPNYSPLYWDEVYQASAPDLLALVVVITISYNIVLAVFNLLPVPPLDGFNVALGVLPLKLAQGFARLAKYGPVILIAILALDSVTNLGIFGRVITPVVNYLGQLILGQGVF